MHIIAVIPAAIRVTTVGIIIAKIPPVDNPWQFFFWWNLKKLELLLEGSSILWIGEGLEPLTN